jgi:sigma-B regulation protein RsbU (phosphoserine phosphatase)
MFAAIFYGIIIPDKNEIYYINGGLEAPVVLNSSGDIINKLVPTGPVVGMFPDMDFTVKSVRLNPGDILFVYTDGSTDAKNSRQELFGEEQLLKTISSPWLSGFSLLFNLNARLSRHIGKQSQYDDITQFVLRRKLFPDENKHSITRKADIDKLEELRDFVEKAVLYCGLNNNFVFAFKIVTEEICTNIIKYGYEGRDNGDIKIEFELEAETALLKIYDYGKGFVPEENQSADINENWETRKIGGLGITLVKGFMDSIDFTKDPDNGNCVLLRKKLN